MSAHSWTGEWKGKGWTLMYLKIQSCTNDVCRWLLKAFSSPYCLGNVWNSSVVHRSILQGGLNACLHSYKEKTHICYPVLLNLEVCISPEHEGRPLGINLGLLQTGPCLLSSGNSTCYTFSGWVCVQGLKDGSVGKNIYWTNIRPWV